VPGRRFDSFSTEVAPERPSDPEVRRANFRRIVRLFQDASARVPADVTALVMAALTAHPAHRAGT